MVWFCLVCFANIKGKMSTPSDPNRRKDLKVSPSCPKLKSRQIEGLGIIIDDGNISQIPSSKVSNRGLCRGSRSGPWNNVYV